MHRHLLFGGALLELKRTLRHLGHLVGLELKVLGEQAEALCRERKSEVSVVDSNVKV